MKKLSNYTFCIVLYCVVNLIVFNMMNIEIVKYRDVVENDNLKKQLESNIIRITKPIGVTDQENKTTNKKNEKPNKEIPNVTRPYSGIDTSSIGSLETYTGIISFYGPDCPGCGNGQTASGYRVGNGVLLYQDATYGKIHIVAGDKKYPFGTIVRFTYSDGSAPILAIVLDRGGVGIGKRFQFDMLCESNARAYQIGIKKNTKIEILRLGY